MLLPAIPLLALGLGFILYQRFKGAIGQVSMSGRNALSITDARGGTLNGIEQNPPASTLSYPPESEWVRLVIDGQPYLVSPTYLAPTGIGEAVDIANANGWVLPTPRMVNAIWQAADLKLAPHPQSHDGTAAMMNSRALTDAQNAYIQSQIGDQSFSLLAGTHKDVCFIDKTSWGQVVGKVGIYGWHKLDGSVIQQEMWGHAPGWKDYSQGLRPMKVTS